MIARDDLVCLLVFLLVAGDAPVDGLLEDGDLILIGARDPGSLTARLDAHGGVLDVLIEGQVGDVHLPDIEGGGPVAALAHNRAEAQCVDFDLSVLKGGGFLVDEGQQEIKRIQMVVVEDVGSRGLLLRQDDLLRPEECSELVVEVLFLLVTVAGVRHP